MKSSITFIIPLSFILLSCGNQAPETASFDSLKVDTIQKTEIIVGDVLMVIDDSNTMDSTAIPVSFVRESLKAMNNENEWVIRKFLSIDSLKSKGAYEAYVKALDIGETKEALAWVYDTVSYQNGKAYLWGITLYSYEACPFYAGKIIYLTTISNEGRYGSTEKLLEISSGGDAPAFGADWGKCVVGENLTIVCNDTSLSGEYGDDGYEDTELVPGLRTYTITPDGKILLQENIHGKEIKRRTKTKN